jgi:hypothetical protein
VLNEDSDHRGGDGDGFFGAKEEAAVRGELAVAGDVAEENAEVDACGDAAAFVDADGDEADVVGVGDGGDGAAVVEGDVDLRGRSNMSRELVMYACIASARGATSRSSLESRPVIGEAVILRMLSAPEPREVRPRDWMRWRTRTMSRG